MRFAGHSRQQFNPMNSRLQFVPDPVAPSITVAVAEGWLAHLESPDLRNTPNYVARREKVRVFPVGASPTRLTRSLQPEAIGAAAQATKPPKPSRQRVASATRRAGRP